jgi:hypothetical protein
LEVYRPLTAVYLGRVEVFTLTTDRAVCKIIKPLQKGVMQKDDEVATQLRN